MAKTPSFITEFRLKVNREQERRLLVRLEAARQGEPRRVLLQQDPPPLLDVGSETLYSL